MAGERLWVLTTKMETGNYGPVAVVSSESVAIEWIGLSGDNDWYSFLKDDLSATSLAGDGRGKEFVPTPEEKKMDTTKYRLQNSQRILDQLHQKRRVKSRAEKLASGSTEEWMVKILSDYMKDRKSRGLKPEVYDFLNHVKLNYKHLPESEYSNLVDGVYELWKKQPKT